LSGIKNRIETWFEKLAKIICANRYKTLVFMLAGNEDFWTLPNITDTTMEGFILEDDPSLVAYEAFKDQFGRDLRCSETFNPNVA